jgi:hypothetical protein
MSVINVKKVHLKKQGFADFEEWSHDPNHVYIGRNMNFYVKGALASKWKNPFTVKKHGLDQCLVLYEKLIRETLYDDLEELDGKVLGCWCKPSRCHGDVLLRLLEEKKL